MDQETREMFGKVLGILEGLRTDVSTLKTDVSTLRTEMDVMKQDMSIMRSRQDEMYLMLKGSEEGRIRIKSLEEKSTISAIERDNLKLESAKIIGALRRGAHEILGGLADEEVS